MKLESEVVLEHRIWNPGTPHMIRVRDRANGCVIFEDTLQGTADWLKFFEYKWSGLNGVWRREPDRH